MNLTTLNLHKTRLTAAIFATLLSLSMFIAVAPAAVVPTSTAPSVAALQKIPHALLPSLNSPEPVNIIVEVTDKAAVIDAVEALGGEVTQVYKTVDAIAASVPADKIIQLAENPAVVKIYEDTVRYLASGPTSQMKEELPPEPTESAPLMETIESKVIDVKQVPEIAAEVTPNGYAVADLTESTPIWEETGYGEDSLVAIIDTGCWHQPYYDPDSGRWFYPWYYGNVIDGVDISADVGTPYEGYDNPMNHYHGCGVASFIAAHVELVFSPGHYWGLSILEYCPDAGYIDDEGYIHVFVFGVAPLAQIYAIKIFDHTGAGVATSVVMAGIDIAIQLKLNGTYDIDIINMSLGGGVGADGEDPLDLLVDEATDAGILVVIAAGNEGPAPLRVGSPGSAKTALTMGGASDPVHERVLGNILLWSYGIPGYYYWPNDKIGVWRWASRGPTADGRQKPDVVSTSSALLFGLTPAELPYTIAIGGGTSFSCPQGAGVAALLNAYIEQQGLSYGPMHIKEAIIEGATPIPGTIPLEVGAGYINATAALEILKANVEEWTVEPHRRCYTKFGSLWYPPIDILHLRRGKVTIEDITLYPGEYVYFNILVSRYVDGIKLTISNVEFAPPEEQNPVFGDAYSVYMSSSERGGVDAYLIGYPDAPQWFVGDAVLLVTSDVDFQPGVVRIVLEGDFSNYQPVHIGEFTIEVTEVLSVGFHKSVFISNPGIPIEEAMVEVYEGNIVTYCGTIKEGESDTYTFTIPDEEGFAYVILSWYRDWAHWATSDLDLYVENPDGTMNYDGATYASPETAMLLAGPGEYTLTVNGYQVYFGKREWYWLRIIYIANPTPLWASSVFSINYFKFVRTPECGVAITWIHDTFFDHWYIGSFAKVKKLW